MSLKRRLTTIFMMLIAAFVIGGTQIAAAHASETELELLGVTEEEYDLARDEAAVAYNNELVAMGWLSADEAADLNERGRFANIGRGQYYDVLDKDVFIADALGMSVAELESAEAAADAAKLAERVEAGRLTEAEAADHAALDTFEATIDEDAVLAQSLGISNAELAAARADNLEYSDLLDQLGLSRDDVNDAEEAIYAELLANAVADGTLTAEQAAQFEDGCNGGRNGGRGRNNGTPDITTADA